MRILTVGNMYPPHHLGGYELAWHSWVAHARATGHEIVVLTTTHRQERPDPGIEDDPAVARELPWYWHEHGFPRLGARAVLRLEREAHSVLDRHLAAETDVVCWWAMGGMPLSLIEAVRRRGLPAVFVVMDDWPVYGPKVDRWQRAMDRPLIRRLGERLGIPSGIALGQGHWLFISDFTRRRVAEADVDLSNPNVVHLGIDESRFTPAAEREWRDRLVCIGRVERRKGQDVAVAALAHLPGYRLRIVGTSEPGFAAEIVRVAERLGVRDRLELAEVGRNRIPGEYADADAVLFPVQWEEPWGLVPLEAMAVGRPVVASGTGGSAEYLVDGENALIYEPRDDPSALADAVRRLSGDRPLREQIRKAGFETAARITEAGFNEAATATVEAAGR